MTEHHTPSRIWACMGGPMVGLFVSGGANGGWPEFIRADIAERMAEALDVIQHFCDDPNGSESNETLAMGLARLLPQARSALSAFKASQSEASHDK